MEYIYIVKTIDLRLKTKESLMKEFEIAKINSPKIWKNRNFDEYIKFLKSWNSDKFSIKDENFSYCTDYKTAYKQIATNSCDMNDGGVYNYAAILQVRTNCGYAETEINNMQVFQFKDGEYTSINDKRNNDLDAIYSFYDFK